MALLLGAASLTASAAGPVVPAGQRLFQDICMACHGEGGRGTAGIAPALAGPLAPVLTQEAGRTYLAQVLLNGLSGRIVSQGQTFMGAMPAQATLGDADLAELANHVAQDLNGLAAAAFTPADFARLRALRPAPAHKDLRELRSRVMP